MTPGHWKVDQNKILSREEIALVLDDLKRRGRRSVNSRQNLTIFRLATCCGLRASEIAGLTLQNIKLSNQKPHINIPRAIAKRKKHRLVPIWWDRSTLDDIMAWKDERKTQGAEASDYFVCALHQDVIGKQLTRINIRHRFQVACRILGDERLVIGEEAYAEDSSKKGKSYTKHLTIHHGRHSFCSHALAGGRSLAEVRDAAGHQDISTTSVYTHVVADDGSVGNLFDFAAPSESTGVESS
jgi:integrase